MRVAVLILVAAALANAAWRPQFGVEGELAPDLTPDRHRTYSSSSTTDSETWTSSSENSWTSSSSTWSSSSYDYSYSDTETWTSSSTWSSSSGDYYYTWTSSDDYYSTTGGWGTASSAYEPTNAIDTTDYYGTATESSYSYEFSGLCNGYPIGVQLKLGDVAVGNTRNRHTTLPRRFVDCGDDHANTGVWASFTGIGRTVTVSSFGSTYDTYIKVYECDGDGYYEEKCIGYNDDCLGTLQSAVSFYARTGHSYRIFLSGYFNSLGNYVLSIQAGSSSCGSSSSSY